MFNVSTIPFVLLAAFLFIKARKQWLPVVMFMTIFPGAAVVTIGGSQGLPIAPAQATLILLLLQKLMSRPPIPRFLPKQQSRISLCLLAFVSYALLAAIFSPFFFAGVPVNNPRNGPGAPLSWSPYNFTQCTYLFLGFLVYVICVYGSRRAEVKQALNWFLAGSVFAAAVAIYQLISFKTGLPFPSAVLHSNTQHVIFEAYETGGFTRVAATFTEASAAAANFAVAIALILWQILFVEVKTKDIVSLLALLTGLLLTTSSGGYLALAAVLVLVAFTYLRKSRTSAKVHAFRISLAIAASIVVVLLAILPQARSAVGSLIDSVLLKKTQSSSYAERTAANQAALQAAAQTWWLGAGWGSLRASSFLANGLGCVGIPGMLIFAAFCVFLVRFASQKPPAQPYALRRYALFPVCIILVNFTISTPEPVDPGVWFLFGVAAFVEPRRRPVRLLLNPTPALSSQTFVASPV